MNHNIPQSLQPHFANVSYDAGGKRIDIPVASAEQFQRPPRIERPIGHAGLHEIAEPIASPPRIVRPHEQQPSLEEERSRYLEAIFTLPPDPSVKDRLGRPMSKRTETTPESEEDALYALRVADGDVRAIVDSFAGDKPLTEHDKLTLLRSNNDLRVALGTHLLDKFRTILTLPERVHKNAPDNLKNPNHVGYPDKMLSRDYAALLALSMLDGTYRERRATGETTEHRTAAEMVLGTYRQLESNRQFYKATGVRISKK